MIGMLLATQYLLIMYNGKNIAGIKYSGVAFFILFIYLLIRKDLSTRIFKVILILLIPLEIYVLIQFFYMQDKILLGKAVYLIFNIALVGVISRKIELNDFFLIFRYSMFINIVFIIFMVFNGTLSYDASEASDFAKSGIMLTYQNISMPVFKGSMIDDSVRCGGLFGHPNTFGLISGMAIIGLRFCKLKIKQYVWWIILFFISFLFTESRASLMMVFVFYLACSILNYNRSVMHKILCFLQIIVGIVGAVFLATLRGDDVTSGRDYLFSLVLNNFFSDIPIHQLLGIGYSCSVMYVSKIMGWIVPIDNSYIVNLIEFGIIGSIMLWGILLYIIYYSIRCSKVAIDVWLPFWCGILCYSFFERAFSFDPESIPWMVFVFMLIEGKTIKKA